MRAMKIALAVLQQGDDYLLQKRGNIPKIGGANLIGLFGGKIEDETPLQAVCREVAEETNMSPKPEDATHWGEVDVTSDHNLEKVVVNAQIFHIKVAKDFEFKAKEGELVKMTKEQAMKQLDSMTPGTAACFRQLVGDK